MYFYIILFIFVKNKQCDYEDTYLIQIFFGKHSTTTKMIAKFIGFYFNTLACCIKYFILVYTQHLTVATEKKLKRSICEYQYNKFSRSFLLMRDNFNYKLKMKTVILVLYDNFILCDVIQWKIMNFFNFVSAKCFWFFGLLKSHLNWYYFSFPMNVSNFCN